MEDFGVNRSKTSIRAKALEKLSRYAAVGVTDDFERINSAVRTRDVASMPMSSKEFEVLVSLASSAQYVSSEARAHQLLHQLGQYLLESPVQEFVNSPACRRASPSPWELATRLLCSAVITLGHEFNELRDESVRLLLGYLERVVNIRDNELEKYTSDLSKFYPYIFSLQGFLKALAEGANSLSGDPGWLLQILEQLNTFVEGEFLITVEGLTSALRVELPDSKGLWLHGYRNYAMGGHEPGALLFTFYVTRFYKAVAKTFIETLESKDLKLDKEPPENLVDVLSHAAPPSALSKDRSRVLEILKDYAFKQIDSLDQGADYIQLETPDRVELAMIIKAQALQLSAVAVYHNYIDLQPAVKLVDSSLHHDHEISYPALALTVFKFASFLSFRDESMGPTIIRALPLFLLNQDVDSQLAWEGTVAAIEGLKASKQDVIVSLTYTLTNMLTPDIDTVGVGVANGARMNNDDSSSIGGSSRLNLAGDNDRRTQIFKNLVTSTVAIATEYGEYEITALASSVLSQKLRHVSRQLDIEVLMGLSKISTHLNEREFDVVLQNYATSEAEAVKTKDVRLMDVVSDARINISRSLTQDEPLFDIYLTRLLSDIVSKGNVTELEHHRPQEVISAKAEEIAVLLEPLAALLPSIHQPAFETSNLQIQALFRDAWFNMVVHGFSKNSQITMKHLAALETIARNTPPLVSEKSTNKIESELELNTVLRRGSSHSNVNNQKEVMSGVMDQHNDFRSLQYPKLMFLATTVLLESLRANTGNCSKVLLYFGDPGFRSGDTGKYMTNIATQTTKAYVTNVLKGGDEQFTVDKVAEQLKQMLVLCCHRVRTVQAVAFTCADLIISTLPAALCKQTSLFALLDLLTLLWTSCLDAETDEYEPRAIFTAPKTGVRLELSDSYDQRRDSLENFLGKSRVWVKAVVDRMSFSVKSLLTDYLAGMGEYRSMSHVALGCTFALEMGGTISKADGELAVAGSQLIADSASGFLSQYIWRTEFKGDEKVRQALLEDGKTQELLKRELDQMLHSHDRYSFDKIRDLLFRASALLTDERECRYVVRAVVKIPFKFFNERSIQLGISLWLWAINEVPKLKPAILSQVATEFENTVMNRQGIYSQKFDHERPDFAKMEYAPSNKAEVDHDALATQRAFAPHVILIRFLSSVFQASSNESRHVLKIFTRLSQVALQGLYHGSMSPLARSVRFELVRFGLDVLLVHSRLSTKLCDHLKNLIIQAALSWFGQPAHWPFGGNRMKLRSDITLLKEVSQTMAEMQVADNEYNRQHNVGAKRNLLLHFLNDELARMSAWVDPLQQSQAYNQGFGKKIMQVGNVTTKSIEQAWAISPVCAVHLADRYNNNGDTHAALERLVCSDPIKVVSEPAALKHFLRTRENRRFLLFWKPVSPIESINLFLPQHGADSLVLQYAMRSLESHDVNVTFFYVPQIVQSLRYDKSGYIKQYILETAKLSQLFAHQIIWNLLANSYKDEDSEIPDELKPTLDDLKERMTQSFNDEEVTFYNREFGFFDEVTSISGKLKPFIKKSKAEKKKKIDEEIDNINVDVGVYLPSNPDGEVIDIDRQSGKPLQSHAKAPFMATFKIRRQVVNYDDGEESNGAVESSDDSSSSEKQSVDVWQSAIFKVGDDCRQDMLALQIIGVFRSIFKHSGLDLYVYPYRVTATAPGCGVIDVLPNSISRDMLGREAVNGLYEYFTTKFGGEDSIDFQRARNNFVKSLAAYSVISYLIQFKDRHNGNIMYDNAGHILHIDFGFCFDIVPGGVKFEAAPFKLTHEMVAVMGGSTHTQAYRWFEELCVKAFLSCRPHCETIIQVVMPMLDSGLPCFKGETTIRNLRARFALEKTERDAALHFRKLVRKSYESIYTKGYDEFQRITNGIPY